MDTATVVNIVNLEIGEVSANKFGWAFTPFILNPPLLTTFRDANGVEWDAWEVLRETAEGYRVAYDCTDQSFLLVTDGVVIASYARLMDVLNGM